MNCVLKFSNAVSVLKAWIAICASQYHYTDYHIGFESLRNHIQLRVIGLSGT